MVVSRFGWLGLSCLVAACHHNDKPAGTSGGSAGGVGTGRPAEVEVVPMSTDPNWTSGVPDCDRYIRILERVSTCEALGAARDGMRQAGEVMMKEWDGWKRLDDASRRAAQAASGPACKQAVAALRESADQVGCDVDLGPAERP